MYDITEEKRILTLYVHLCIIPKSYLIFCFSYSIILRTSYMNPILQVHLE